MKQSISISEVDFGQPEAEHDANALDKSFYEAESWKLIAAAGGMPFVVGRKGSGKSAIAARLQITAKKGETPSCFIRFVPADFRHVEVRDLLACLVNKGSSWQYIYRKVWEGIVLGQIVRHFSECPHLHNAHNISPALHHEIDRFQAECGFYVAALGDALSDVIAKHVRDVAKKTDALSQVDLRKRLEPYAWASLIQALEHHFTASHPATVGMFIVIDGLDEHWDTSDASLFFLAELLAVAKDFTAKFGASMRFLVCLRDNIFRTLVDTRSVEYDKLESLVINLIWNSHSLLELVARRVAPSKNIDSAVDELRNLLPESVQGVAVEDYLARHILQRPRDYINFFRMLQKECRHEPRAGEGHIQDTVARYCANRLIDLENEFGFTYPHITKCITALPNFPDTFPKEMLIERLADLCQMPSFRAQAPELVATYGQPSVLARILVSIGVVGIYDSESHSVRFIHEFSESRVAGIWESAVTIGIHPVYVQKRSSEPLDGPAFPEQDHAPAIVAHPSDYVATKDSLTDLESYDAKMARKCGDLIASFAAIDKGQAHFRRFELWVKDTISLCFIGDLVNAEEQITVGNQSKRFEVIFDIVGTEPPWPEIKGKYRTHRLLVECKNTEEPTDADFSKLDRDMLSLDVDVAFLAYRGSGREPQGKVLEYQRSVFINSTRRRIIVALSQVFLIQCLNKQTARKCRQNLNKLWRDHVQRWLAT
jgi:hypothetical protein